MQRVDGKSFLLQPWLSFEYVPHFGEFLCGWRTAFRNLMVAMRHSKLEREPEGEDIVCARNGGVCFCLGC